MATCTSNSSSYFIASRQSRQAVVVDPQLETQPYLDLAAERGYSIAGVIDTHLHEAADVLFPFHRLKDQDEITIGQVVLRVVHTPGHRPEMISLLVTNPPRSPEPAMVLSGDCLLVGDVGRPDFGGPEGAIEEYHSIHRLLGLPDWVEVFPAHFEGSCGKGMCGRPSTTIGFERRYNPVLQLGRDEFIRLESQVPARPLNMMAILETNRGAADCPWALSIPQADLATRLAEVPKDRDLLVVCARGMRSTRCTAFLRQMGFDRAISMDGGTDGWREAGHRIVAGR